MSTVILDKDHEGKKAGETISVPFGVGKQMITAGIGHYPASTAKTPVPAKAEPTEIAAMKAAHLAEVSRLQKEANAAMELADKATTENAELKKKLADLEKNTAAKGHK